MEPEKLSVVSRGFTAERERAGGMNTYNTQNFLGQ